MDVKDGRDGAPCPELVASVVVAAHLQKHRRGFSGVAGCGGGVVTGATFMRMGVALAAAAARDGSDGWDGRQWT